MRFLGVGDACDLGALYLQLKNQGHEVKVFTGIPACQDVLDGLLDKIPDWKQELDWIRAAGDDGIIIFENVGRGLGATQDELRRQGFNVVGGSAYGDRLENDRAYGQSVLSEVGLATAPHWNFKSRADAVQFIRERPARYVLKFNESECSQDNFIGRLHNGADVLAALGRSDETAEKKGFILSEFIPGIEMGVGAYFDGKEFLLPACLDWEHKRFFPGDLGELTGEMGTVVTYDRTHTFFESTLGRLQPRLREHGHCGYVNLNTIVNENGIWPLEFTSRFGYPGYAILSALQLSGWDELFRMMTRRDIGRFETRPGFAVGLLISTPPFPLVRPELRAAKGLPVFFDPELTAEDERNIHLGEVSWQNEYLVTSGSFGWTLVVTGTGDDVREAQEAANRLAGLIHVPDGRYRRDIGDKLIKGEFAQLEQWGLLDPVLRVPKFGSARR